MQLTDTSDTKLKQWATLLRERNLTDVALILVEGAYLWGFVGAQLLWMLMPLVQNKTCAEFAAVLENPEALRQFQQYLSEGKL